jgi:1-acyl-sn-glycerol-3-phosphate acyltransferase
MASLFEVGKYQEIMSWRHTTVVGVVYLVLVTAIFGSSAIILGILQCVFCRLWPGRGDLVSLGVWSRWLWARSLLWFFEVKVEMEGPGSRQVPKSCVMVSNHQSALDIVVFASSIPHPFGFLSKKELLMIPIFGWAAWMSGTIYIDRKRGAKDSGALQQFQRVLRRGGSISIFPEGTRSKTEALLPFKRGAFVMAIEAQADVLPVVLIGSGALMQKGQLKIRPGTIRMWIGEPISTKGLRQDDRFALCDKAREIISNRLDLRT